MGIEFNFSVKKISKNENLKKFEKKSSKENFRINSRTKSN